MILDSQTNRSRRVRFLIWYFSMMAATGVLVFLGNYYKWIPGYFFSQDSTTSFGVFSMSPGFSCGVYSVAMFSAGFFSTGIFSIGVFSTGVFSFGLFSFGIMAVGYWVVGIAVRGHYKKQFGVRVLKEDPVSQPLTSGV